MAAESAATSAEENVAANAKTSSAPSVIADAAMDLCAHCTAAPGLLVCLGCHQAGYCSLTCQQGAWWVGLATGFQWLQIVILHPVYTHSLYLLNCILRAGRAIRRRARPHAKSAPYRTMR